TDASGHIVAGPSAATPAQLAAAILALTGSGSSPSGLGSGDVGLSPGAVALASTDLDRLTQFLTPGWPVTVNVVSNLNSARGTGVNGSGGGSGSGGGGGGGGGFFH